MKTLTNQETKRARSKSGFQRIEQTPHSTNIIAIFVTTKLRCKLRFTITGKTIILNIVTKYRKISHKIGNIYECTICSYKAPAPSTLKKHMVKHTKERDYKCNVCDYAASTVSQRFVSITFSLSKNCLEIITSEKYITTREMVQNFHQSLTLRRQNWWELKWKPTNLTLFNKGSIVSRCSSIFFCNF